MAVNQIKARGITEDGILPNNHTISDSESIQAGGSVNDAHLSRLFRGKINNIPELILDGGRNLNWKEVANGLGKMRKTPVNESGDAVGYNDPAALVSLADCEALMRKNGWGMGVSLGPEGLELKEGQYLWCCDYDGFVKKDTSGDVDNELEPMLDRLDTYTEISPSVTGCKAFCLSDKKPETKSVIAFGPSEFAAEFPDVKKYQAREIEIFSKGFFLTLTGDLYSMLPR